MRQTELKPQDVVVALKLAVHPQEPYTFAQLATELDMSASEAHSAAMRLVTAGLFAREQGRLLVISRNIRDFLVYGVRYAFPAITGPATRGMVTGKGLDWIADNFIQGFEPYVWPDPIGQTRGPSLVPLHPNVPLAASRDKLLYDALALVDMMRIGDAREREFASRELGLRF